MPGMSRFYNKNGRSFTLLAYQVGSRYLGVILTDLMGFQIIEEHVPPGAGGAVNAAQVKYFTTADEAIVSCRNEIDACFLHGDME